MDIAIVFSRALSGIRSPLVTVEVHLSRGLPRFTIVGLPETAVKESKDRVRSAILSNQLEFPLGRITVNLAPADLPKDGGRFDLAIAIGILAASGQVAKPRIAEHEYIGELALTGELRQLNGILAIANSMSDSGRSLILPVDNADEAALIQSLEVLPASHLLQVCAHLNGTEPLAAHPGTNPGVRGNQGNPGLEDIRGQHQAKRALEVAAAGSHNLLMIGPPGTGKTMLAQRLPGLLPPLTEQQALESAAIASISRQGFRLTDWKKRPIRSPHHTASAVALVGGGSQPRPGEISLAHNGVLFLDELPEFERRVLEVLREPLESGHIAISRAARQCEFPANFQLLAAMNPCPCGYLGDPGGRCHCTYEAINRYRNRVSGPLLDRIDIHIEVIRVATNILRNCSESHPEKTETVRRRVESALQRQLQRCGKPNCRLDTAELERHCRLSNAQLVLLDRAISRLGLSARGTHRIVRVARTIADLADSDRIHDEHLLEAIGYRQLDKAAGPGT